MPNWQFFIPHFYPLTGWLRVKFYIFTRLCIAIYVNHHARVVNVNKNRTEKSPRWFVTRRFFSSRFFSVKVDGHCSSHLRGLLIAQNAKLLEKFTRRLLTLGLLNQLLTSVLQLPVAQPRHVRRWTSSIVLRCFVSRCRGALRHLESLRADRAIGWRSAKRKAWVAVLDKAGRGHCWADGRNCLHVHSVQAVLKFMFPMESSK